MKKLLVLVLFCISYISCDPGKFLNRNDGNWYVKNNTSDVILISNEGHYIKQPLAPKDSVNVYSVGFTVASNIIPEFKYILGRDCDGRETHINIQVYSEDGKLLKTWDNQDEQSLQSDFFKESKWKVRRGYNKNGSVLICWTYDITEETLKQ